jgi:hypothetical protein
MDLLVDTYVFLWWDSRDTKLRVCEFLPVAVTAAI